MARVQETITEDCARFLELRASVGADVALFILSGWRDVPYNPEISAQSWDGYLRQSRFNENPEKRFKDGETDIRSALDEGMADMERWLRVWGLGDPEHPYTDADYRQLDYNFKVFSARLKDSGGYDERQEDVIRTCSKMALLRDKSIAAATTDSIKMAKDLDKMINDNLANENLRAKDAGPKQTVRIDGIVEACEKKFGFGIFASYDQVMEAIVQWLNEKGRYANSTDAAEQAIRLIANCTRGNSDLPPMSEEEEQSVNLGQFSREFDQRAIKGEAAAYKYLGSARRKYE